MGQQVDPGFPWLTVFCGRPFHKSYHDPGANSPGSFPRAIADVIETVRFNHSDKIALLFKMLEQLYPFRNLPSKFSMGRSYLNGCCSRGMPPQFGVLSTRTSDGTSRQHELFFAGHGSASRGSE